MARSIQSGHVLSTSGIDRLFTSTISSSNLIETANLLDFNQTSSTLFNSTILSYSNFNSTSVCTPLVDQQLQNPLVIFSVICMVIINLVVILGNLLVIFSVFFYTKLRTVTNFFIVSLAVADLLLGLTVVPYSLTQTISKAWYFGKIWCIGWLVIDVWLSTASILNLVAISVDRYLAITKPLKYRTMMTAKRAKLLIACAWIVSFLICFPPLVHTGWNQQNSGLIEVNITQKTINSHSTKPQTHPFSTSSLTSSSLNQFSSNLYSPKQINTVELNRWSLPFFSDKFFHKSDSSRRNKRDRYSDEVVITSMPLIADLNQIWLSDQINNEFIINNLKETPNHKEKIKTKFKIRLKQDSRSLDNQKRTKRNSHDKEEINSFPQINQSKYNDGKLRELKKNPKKQNETFEHLKRLRRASIDENSNENNYKNSKLIVDCDYQVLQCILFDSKGYVIYSAVGSFFIPMLVMIFFYWRIYLVATYTTKSMNRGYISKKSFRKNPMTILRSGSKNQIDSFNTIKYGSANLNNNNFDANSEINSNLTLRVHRGYFKDQQLNTNLTDDLTRRSANRSSYDSTGRSSTSTTVTVRANSTTVDSNAAAQLCRRLLPTRLSNRLLSNNDAKQLRKIQHRSVRCLDRTQNIITLAADASKPRTSAILKRTQSEQCIEMNANTNADNPNKPNEEVNKFEIDLDRRKVVKELNNNESRIDNNKNDKGASDKRNIIDHIGCSKLIDSSMMRISNSERNLPQLQLKIKPYSLSSGNLINKEPQKFSFSLTKGVQMNPFQTGSQIQLNIVSPQEDKTFNQNSNRSDNLVIIPKPLNHGSIIGIEDNKDRNQQNGYLNNAVKNNNQKKEHNIADQIEIVDTNCNNLMQTPPTIQLSTSSSAKSKNSYWSRFSRKRIYLSKTPNQNTNSSGRFEKKRFLAETKAAKTVGIIVGCFWVCWFPFFTVYLTRGLCTDKNCIPDSILTIFTWLGYFNSAANPIIYGMFSKDFRRAFKNIICKCKFSEEAGISTLIRQIHLPNLFEDEMI